MIVDDFHSGWAGASLGPLETNPPLVVDPDTPLPPATAPQTPLRVEDTQTLTSLAGFQRDRPGGPYPTRNSSYLRHIGHTSVWRCCPPVAPDSPGWGI